MALIKIEILRQQHYFVGDRYYVFLKQPATNMSTLIATSNDNNFLSTCEKLDGLKIRLEQLGNDVVVESKFEADPNFNSYEEACKALTGK